MDLRVLVACEESQVVCKAFRAKGFDAYSCDILPCSGGHPEWHLQCNVAELLDQKWDLIIAHPPCTYISKAGARWMYPTAGTISHERLLKAFQARAFFELFYYYEGCEHIAIENPRPLKVVRMPKESQIIQPYEFGDPYSKATFLWLKGLPLLKSTKVIEDYVPWMPSNTSGYSKGKGGSYGIAHDKRLASRTFPGIADAMANQWGKYLLENL